MKKRKFKGFTLIEIVIVIAIITIIIGIAAPKYSKARERAKITAHNANVQNIKNAAEIFLMNHDGEELEMKKLKEYMNEIPKPYYKNGTEGGSTDNGSTDDESAKEFSVELKDNEIVVTPGEIKPED